MKTDMIKPLLIFDCSTASIAYAFRVGFTINAAKKEGHHSKSVYKFDFFKEPRVM